MTIKNHVVYVIMIVLLILYCPTKSFTINRLVQSTLALNKGSLIPNNYNNNNHFGHNYHLSLYESIKNNNIEPIDCKGIGKAIKSNYFMDFNNLSINTSRIILIIVSALYGTNFGCVKILGEAMDPSIAALLRFSVAALVFLPYVLKFAKTNKDMIIGGIEVGIYSALGYWGQSVALQTSSASSTAFICSLAVIVVPILDMFLSEKKSLKPWYEPLIPALIAVLGVGCLELGGTELPVIGDLWAFAQPLFFGLSFWKIEKYMKLSTGQPGEAQAFTGSMLLAVAAGSLVWALADIVQPLHWNIPAVISALKIQFSSLQSLQVLAAVAWTGIITTAITSYGENIAMKKLTATESTIIYSTEPIWGTAFASFALHESIGWNTIVGATLVLAACLWSTLGPSVSLAGALSTNKAVTGVIFEDLADNIMMNWSDLLSKLGFTPDL